MQDAFSFDLTEDDLLGYEPEELRCTQCAGAFCGSRSGRLLEGEAFIMCGQKDEVKEVLSALSERRGGRHASMAGTA